MKIARIEACWLHVPIPVERQHVSDFGRIAAFDTTLVEIRIESGLVDHGETKSAVGGTGDNRALVTLINRELAPMLVGQNARGITRIDFKELAELRAVDIFQPDLAICCAITEAWRIAALAGADQIRLAPHLWGGAVMFAAVLPLSAAAPAALIVEYSLGANQMPHDLVEEDFPCVKGQIEILDHPGLGLTIDPGFVRAYRVA